MSGPWKPENYRDTYRDRVAQLIEDKRKGETVVTEGEPPDPTEMSDLLAALERSVEAARKGGGSAGKGDTASKTRPADTASKTRETASKAPEDDPLQGASKTELRRRARELDVPGRSKMSRTQLERAVTKAS